MLSFFRKLSIGGKIKDGILPDGGVMGTAEDLLRAKNQCALILKDENELKDSVYGKTRFSLFRSIFFSTFSFKILRIIAEALSK